MIESLVYRLDLFFYMCDKIKIPQNFKKNTNNNYDERIVPEWRAFESIFGEFSTQWIFRGQQVCFWSLSSSIDRKRELNGWNTESVESLFLEHFPKNISKDFRDYFNPQNSLEWLSLIQHYGGVTGLLDWTSCPYTASFFAFNGGINIDTIKEMTKLSTCLVREFFKRIEGEELINRSDNEFICCDQFEEKIENSNINNETKEKLLEFKYCVVWAVNSQWLKKWAYSRITSVQQYRNLSMQDITKPENFDKLFFKSPDLLGKYFVLPVCPGLNKSNFLNERIKVQKGLFLRQSDVTDSFENNLIFEATNNYPLKDERKTYIKKFLIPKTNQLRADVLEVLAKKSINKKYLFIGEDKFRDKCKSVILQLERYASSALCH